MDSTKEAEIIYGLMREIIIERRELSKQYYDLKIRLDDLHNQDKKFVPNSIEVHSESIEKMSTIPSKAKVVSSNKRRPKISFERVAGYVVEILKQSAVPMNSKSLFEQAIQERKLQINYQNFRNNILPRIGESKSFHVEKAYRGYWQYKRGV